MGLRFQAGFAAIVLAAALLAVPVIVPAGARDHDEARRAAEAGEIRPLAEILNFVGGKLPGEIVRVKIERENGLWVYEFRVVDSKGRLFEVYVDGRTGEIKRIKEK
ncbi:MAG: PepSY domain-containing protein [Variibacter sp.]